MWKLKCVSTLMVAFKIIFPCYLLFLLVCTLNDGRRKLAASPRRETTRLDPSDGQELAVCRGNLLDQRHYRFVKEKDGYYRFTSDQTGPCRLLQYTTEHIVSCFDSLRNRKLLAGELDNSSSSLHFMFVGDSRIRQQYYNFVRLIPDYDQIRQPIHNVYAFHDEMEITSLNLKLRLSYRWRPVINDNLDEMIRLRPPSDPTGLPHLLFIGIVLHHMLEGNKPDLRLFEEKFAKLASELGRLANVTQVIWFNQYPIVDLHEKEYKYASYDIHSEKIHNYNKVIRRLLENENSGICIWDSSNPLADEYTRSCAVLRRDEIVDADSRPYLFKESAFTDCNDYIHTGYSALSQATNLLYNDICNDVMDFY